MNTWTLRIRRLTVLAGTIAAVAVQATVAQAATDGTLLSRAAQKAETGQAQTSNVSESTDAPRSDAARFAKIDRWRGTDGALLSKAARDFQLRELATINPGRVTDGMLLSEASLLDQLRQIDPGRGTDSALLSDAAGRTVVRPVSDGFDWGDAAAGFGLAGSVALLGAAALMLRRRGALAHAQ